MDSHSWKEKAACYGYDTNFFFDKYEEDEQFRPAIDNLCMGCPVIKECFAIGVSQKEWGVWGGIYIENGQISKEFNSHKNKQDWEKFWRSLTMDR